MVRWLLAPIVAGALIITTGSFDILAQQPVQVRIDSVNTSEYPRLQASVTVLDATGRPITGIPSQAFSADSDGVTLPVIGAVNALDANVPAAVVLAFDTSGSMQGPAIEQARQAGKALVGELGTNDQVSIVRFADTVQLVQGFTNDRAALTAAIDSLNATGSTALYDGVVTGVNTALGASPERRAVVLLSDGLDSGGVSQSDRGSSLAAAQPAGIPFFVVGLGDSIDQAYLQELASVTRGQLFVAPSPEALLRLYETIGAALRHQYILDLDAAGLNAATAKALRIQVDHGGTIASGQTQIDLVAFAPTQEPTPGPATASPVATAAPAPTTETEDGGTSPLLPAVAGLAALALLGGAGGTLWIRSRRAAALETATQLRRPDGRGPAAPVFAGTGPLGAPVKADAWLEVVQPEQFGRFSLGEDPVTVGFTGDCTIRLPDGGDQIGTRLRVWKREGRYMLHNLTRLGKVIVAGKPATWAILEDGDLIELGSSRLVFRTTDTPASDL
jgi:VWFA-related protein